MHSPEDLSVIERAGRRCESCHSGRHWRRFEVVRSGDHDPVVLCPACLARSGAQRTVPEARPAASVAPVPVSRPAASVAPAPASQPAAASPVSPPKADAPEPESAPGEDRLKRALRELPSGAHSVARIAKAAGLNHERTLTRLRAMEAAGEIQQVGKRWSSERPSSDVEAAFDRLQARTTNLRIIRDREPVG